MRIGEKETWAHRYLAGNTLMISWAGLFAVTARNPGTRALPPKFVGPRYLLVGCFTLIAIFTLWTFSISGASAQESAEPDRKPLKVGLYVSQPFVMKEDGKFTGMAVELWETLAAKLKLQFKYEEFSTVRELMQATSSGNLDVAVTNLTITEERVERIDFTHPWFDAGLRLMVNEHQGTSFRDVVTGLREAGFLRSYALLATIILVATFLLTAFDRHYNKDFPRRWREGLAEDFYHVMSVATSGKAPARKAPFGWIGRIFSALWLVSGVAVLAYVTSTVTSVMTAISLTHHINSLSDLQGRTAGVFSGSVAETFAHDSGAAYRSFANIDDAVVALLDGRIDAIIGDAPVLEYYAHIHPSDTIKVVGAIFEPDKYGFGLPRDSKLTRPLTVAIVAVHESGFLESLNVKYFSDIP